MHDIPNLYPVTFILSVFIKTALNIMETAQLLIRHQQGGESNDILHLYSKKIHHHFFNTQ